MIWYLSHTGKRNLWNVSLKTLYQVNLTPSISDALPADVNAKIIVNFNVKRLSERSLSQSKVQKIQNFYDIPDKVKFWLCKFFIKNAREKSRDSFILSYWNSNNWIVTSRNS